MAHDGQMVPLPRKILKAVLIRFRITQHLQHLILGQLAPFLRMLLHHDKADGRELFKKLARTADVIIESCEPGYLDSLGLGYPSISDINPDIIMTAITP